MVDPTEVKPVGFSADSCWVQVGKGQKILPFRIAKVLFCPNRGLWNQYISSLSVSKRKSSVGA